MVLYPTSRCGGSTQFKILNIALQKVRGGHFMATSESISTADSDSTMWVNGLTGPAHSTETGFPLYRVWLYDAGKSLILTPCCGPFHRIWHCSVNHWKEPDSPVLDNAQELTLRCGPWHRIWFLSADHCSESDSWVWTVAQNLTAWCGRTESDSTGGPIKLTWLLGVDQLHRIWLLGVGA